ncbi:hypothetical protein [Candidatus Methylacidiphilum fumarolicum]|uniref:hypothetical protein n=1 Tax=Candidatus Methylacidiphilum fumarolicum TaxID=591154 RepID=UPI00141BD8E9|nr:hypothetical protein [Candidatus Methylacidiphilum fumarolicum]
MSPEFRNTPLNNGSGQGMAFQLPAPIQVFDNNGMKPSGKVGHELVPTILPDIGDAGVEPG